MDVIYIVLIISIVLFLLVLVSVMQDNPACRSPSCVLMEACRRSCGLDEE